MPENTLEADKQPTTLEKKVWEALKDVPDPEIPMVSVVDLGIITAVEEQEDGGVIVKMTPTFSGCPAINLMRSTIENKVKKLLNRADVEVQVDKTVQWNSNLISEEGLKALKKFGLAPPPRYTGELDVETISKTACPYCDSLNTRMESPFGPTLCRSIHYCDNCKQSFEQFKPL